MRYELLYTESDIQKRIQCLGKQIRDDYEGKEFVILGVLTGAFIFVADLVRQINGNFEVCFINAKSYGENTESSGQCVIGDCIDLKNKHILIVDDIADTNLTLKKLIDKFTDTAKSVKTCVLFHKSS